MSSQSITEEAKNKYITLIVRYNKTFQTQEIYVQKKITLLQLKHIIEDKYCLGRNQLFTTALYCKYVGKATGKTLSNNNLSLFDYRVANESRINFGDEKEPGGYLFLF